MFWASSEEKPTTPANGVRISWVMVAMNSFLELSRSRSAAWTSFNSVMFIPVTIVCEKSVSSSPGTMWRTRYHKPPPPYLVNHRSPSHCRWPRATAASQEAVASRFLGSTPVEAGTGSATAPAARSDLAAWFRSVTLTSANSRSSSSGSERKKASRSSCEALSSTSSGLTAEKSNPRIGTEERRMSASDRSLSLRSRRYAACISNWIQSRKTKPAARPRPNPSPWSGFHHTETSTTAAANNPADHTWTRRRRNVAAVTPRLTKATPANVWVSGTSERPCPIAITTADHAAAISSLRVPSSSCEPGPIAASADVTATPLHLLCPVTIAATAKTMVATTRMITPAMSIRRLLLARSLMSLPP